VLDGEQRGAAAAINLGIRTSRFEIICQVDQDVIVKPGWLHRLLEQLQGDDVAAAQGHYVAASAASVWTRVMAVDLRQRYAEMDDAAINHVCTGNTAYRADALRRVGLFDESLGYGYDNDMSYRLEEAGYRLHLCREAEAVHLWRDGVRGYVRQQYGFGYGRLDLIAKHPNRVAGDAVSPWPMMMHAPLMLVAMLTAMTAFLFFAASGPWPSAAALAAAALGVILIERIIAATRAFVRFRDPAALLMPPVHLLRDFAWACAIVTWTLRRVTGRASSPIHRMSPRQPEPARPEQ
jgi:cellulose synthase/poly-beta-1,6-N-acetylglucosamine synthase-like glycosyltransferase